VVAAAEAGGAVTITLTVVAESVADLRAQLGQILGSAPTGPAPGPTGPTGTAAPPAPPVTPTGAPWTPPPVAGRTELVDYYPNRDAHRGLARLRPGASIRDRCGRSTPAMIRAALAVLVFVGPVFGQPAPAPAPLYCTEWRATNPQSVTVTGICANWRAWRLREGGLLVTCAGATPPLGAIEMRDYYRVGDRL
jgi:hypothetical protein